MTNEIDSRKPDDDVLAMRELLRNRPAPQGDSAIAPGTLRAFFDGELSAEEAQTVALAMVEDPSLAEDMRVTTALARAQDEPSARVEPLARPATSRFVWTAVAAIAAGIVAFWLMRSPAPTSEGSDEIRAGGETSQIVAIVPEKELTRDAFDLAWSGGPEEATWDVHVTTEELKVVFQAFDQTESRVRVPAGALVGLESGATLLWRVTATDARGGHFRSPAFPVQVP